jgi:hypothetical protein
MPQGPDYLVKLSQGGETVYLFCSSGPKFPSSALEAVGLGDLQDLYNNAPKADGVAILPEYPPPGPTKPDGSKDRTLNWETYAAKIQVGP